MTKLFGVIGKPILHSKSPAIFTPLLNSNEFYLRLAVDSCSEAISLSSDLPLCGINITSPFKHEAFEIAKSYADSAMATKAVNTLIADEECLGLNTDVDGVKGALRNIQLKGKKVLILGAGGAASAAAYAVSLQGANLFFWNRTKEKAEYLASKFKGKIFNPDANTNVEIIISTIPSETKLFDESIINSSVIILDAVYGKNTWISKIGKEKNCLIIPGETWLLEHAKSSASSLLKREATLNQFKSDQRILSPKKIFLLGLMGAGKSTSGKILAQQRNLPFIDLDKEMELREKCSIKQIFLNKGEEYFRDREFELLKEYSSSDGVFATGGGVVEREASREILTSVSSINVWLWAKSKTLESRIQSTDRPLASKLTSLSSSRTPLYAECADLFLSSETRSPEKCAERISYEICETWSH